MLVKNIFKKIYKDLCEGWHFGLAENNDCNIQMKIMLKEFVEKNKIC